MIINIAHIVHISHLSQPKKFTWGSGDQNPNEIAFRSTTLSVKTRAADPHSFFVDTDPDPAVFLMRVRIQIQLLKKIYLTKSFLVFSSIFPSWIREGK